MLKSQFLSRSYIASICRFTYRNDLYDDLQKRPAMEFNCERELTISCKVKGYRNTRGNIIKGSERLATFILFYVFKENILNETFWSNKPLDENYIKRFWDFIYKSNVNSTGKYWISDLSENTHNQWLAMYRKSID